MPGEPITFLLSLEPGAQPTEPEAQPAEPEAQPAEPGAQPAEPEAQPAEPEAQLKIVVKLTKEMMHWADTYGYTATDAGEHWIIRLDGLVEYTEFLNCLSDGYMVLGCGTSRYNEVDLTQCERVYISNAYCVTEETYDAITRTPKPNKLVPIVMDHHDRRKIAQGNVIDVVSPTRKDPVRLRWMGVHPDFDSAYHFARVL